MFFSYFGLFFTYSLAFTRGDTSENRAPSLYCTDLNPQNSVDLDQIMGLWYGSEILTHHEGEEGVFYYDSCVVIHLADISAQVLSSTEASHRGFNIYHQSTVQNNRYLRLIWDEMGTNLEYSLRYNNTRRGLWISSGPQKGTMLNMQYRQFSGTIQVMKAVGNHLVLTFCNSLPGSKFFTIVLTRSPNSLTYEETQSIRNLLRRRGLSTASVRKVCTNNAQNLSISMVFLLFAFLLSR